MLVSRAKNLRGTVEMPGDKSVSHRAAILAALADGKSVLTNFSHGADCNSTLSCLEKLGAEVVRDGNTVTMTGRGPRGLAAPAEPLDCGNSGTTMRLLAGVLAGQGFESELRGDSSLSNRPMGRVIEPLAAMGAAIGSENGRPPLSIKGAGPLKPLEYQMPVASAQVKSSILLAGLFADGTTTVIEETPTRDHTERMLPEFGVQVAAAALVNGTSLSVTGGGGIHPADIEVPGDVSSAAFFLAAAAALPGSGLTIRNVGLNATRIAFPELIRSLGGNITLQRTHDAGGESVGSITVTGGELATTASMRVVSGSGVASLIDEIPVIAVLATQVAGGIEIRDAGELRHKESDRIASVAENLRRMGADVEEFSDGLRVGASRLRGTTIETFGDHRIAMAFAVAGLFAEGDTEIVGPECADISFPGFFELLRSLVTNA